MSKTNDDEVTLDLLADVCGDIAKALDAIGKGDLSVKVRKGEMGLRSVAEASRKLPEVLRAVGITYENSAVARLERKLRNRGILKDRPSVGIKS